MTNRIAILCVNPWESFLPSVAQSRGREYYQWVCGQALLRDLSLYCQERIEVYGESAGFEEQELFLESEGGMQFLYVQSCRRQLLKRVFEKSDIVIMGLPGCKKEFDKIFMSIFPWKDKIMFLWDKHMRRGEEFLRQLCCEYKIRETQMIEIRRGLDGALKK